MTQRSDQYTKLNALIEAAILARDVANEGMLFASVEGKRFTEAAFQLFEIDQLHELANDIELGQGLTVLSGKRAA